jgi:hypothetical protein
VVPNLFLFLSLFLQTSTYPPTHKLQESLIVIIIYADVVFADLDGDVYIFNSFPNELLSGDLIAQNIEQDFDYFKELVGLVNQTFDYVPMPLKMQVEKSIPIQASNAGILGGKDHGFF